MPEQEHRSGCVVCVEDGQWFFDPDLSIASQRGRVILPGRSMLSDDPAERRRECWELLCGVADSASDGVAYLHIEPDTSSCLAINRTELRLRGYFNGTADMALLGKAQNIGTVLQRWLATMEAPDGK